MDIALHGLNVTISGSGILKNIEFSLAEGESVGIVGESGSGKTMLVRSVTGLLPHDAEVSGEFLLSGKQFDINSRERNWRDVRGKLIGMIMQDPFTALDPMAKCGRQIVAGVPRSDRSSFDIAAALDEVGLAADTANKYPFELSGGMRQRVVIAAALATRPRILIADEATTALDVITQREILDLIDGIRSKRSMPFVMITHDIRLVRERTERIIVINNGEIAEEGATEDVVSNPQSDYTKLLIDADRSLRNSLRIRSSDIGGGSDFHMSAPADAESDEGSILLKADGIKKHFGSSAAVDNVSISIKRGEIVGVVGQSGSGKTTLARCIVGLEKPDGGNIMYSGRTAPQIVFQDPYSSLNPAHTVEYILKEALKVSGRPLSELDDILALAEIDKELLDRRPAALSGGQRQRVAIARALAPDPQLLICDESVSALDLVTQNQILATIRKLSIEKSLAILFITHDLSVVRALANRIYVMNKAHIVEEGETENVFLESKDEYTKALIAASELGAHARISREGRKITLYTNARIYTVAGAGWEKLPVSCMAADTDGKLTALGEEQEVRAAADEVHADIDKVVDLGGKTVLPGFIDTHVHMPGDALTELFQIYLYDCRGREETLETVRNFIDKNSDREMYFGTGFYLSIADGSPEGPRREWLDEIEKEKPIILESSDGHSFWMNSAAFSHFGIDEHTEAPTGGVICRDPSTGIPTGLMTDAHSLVAVRPEYSIQQAEQALDMYQRKMLGWGYTGAMHIAPQFCDPLALKHMCERGEWFMRVNLSSLADHEADVPATEAAFAEAKLYEDYFADSDIVKTTTVKFFADGVVEGRTAYLKEPYAQICPGEPCDYRSEPLWDKDELAIAFSDVMKRGYQIHVHSIGDAATSETLDALEKAEALANVKDGRRDVISHLQLVSPDDIARMKNLGVIASFQPFWHFREPGWYDQIDLAVLGRERAEAAYPVGSCVRAGVKVAFSGDYPVSSCNNPFTAIQIAVTRNLADSEPYGEVSIVSVDDPKWLRNKGERISLAEAIEAYTINGAYQLFREAEIGSLESGKQADFIVLDEDPFEVDEVELYRLHPLRVFIGGREIRKH